MKRLAKDSGLTLLELVVVVALLSVLASAVMPLAHISSKRARELELKQNLRKIRTALDVYKKAYDDKRMENEIGRSGYPKSLTELVEGATDIKSAEGHMIYFMRRMPRDPMNDNEFLTAEETWELRSYDSPPDDFSGGDDVYDIRSSSEQTALNETEYKDW